FYMSLGRPWQLARHSGALMIFHRRPSEQAILSALREVNDPVRGGNVVDLGMVTGVAVKDGVVSFAIEVPAADAPQREPLRAAAAAAAARVPGVVKVNAVLTASAAAPVRAGSA